MSRGTKIALIVIAAVLVVGLATGLIIWAATRGGSTKDGTDGHKPETLEITKLAVTRSDGKPLDTKNVPAGIDLTANATVRSKAAKARLKIAVFDAGGEEVGSKTFALNPSSNLQNKEYEFKSDAGSGTSYQVVATVFSGSVEQAKVSVRYSLGKGGDLEQARKRAQEKLAEADRAVQELRAKNIEASDLVETLADADNDLSKATTVADYDAVYDTAVRVLAECEKRSETATEEHNREVCRLNQRELYTHVINYNKQEGNYPDSMEQLVQKGFIARLPICPSGGKYSYSVDYAISPEKLKITCTVHGSLF